MRPGDGSYWSLFRSKCDKQQRLWLWWELKNKIFSFSSSVLATSKSSQVRVNLKQFKTNPSQESKNTEVFTGCGGLLGQFVKVQDFNFFLSRLEVFWKFCIHWTSPKRSSWEIPLGALQWRMDGLRNRCKSSKVLVSQSQVRHHQWNNWRNHQ